MGSRVFCLLRFQQDNPQERTSESLMFIVMVVSATQLSCWVYSAGGFGNSHNSEFKHENLGNLVIAYTERAKYTRMME